MLIIVSLCDYSGAWSEPYRRRGYHVEQVDLKLGHDARLWPSRPSADPRPPSGFEDIRPLIGRVRGVLAAPVCTVLANSGARHLRSDEDIREGLALVDACVRIAWALQPAWWVMENPVGKLVKWLGDPVMWFDPCDYGDPYTKRTGLWGKFRPPLMRPVFPSEGSKMHARYGGSSERTKTARSMTPPGFSEAFCEANP